MTVLELGLLNWCDRWKYFSLLKEFIRCCFPWQKYGNLKCSIFSQQATRLHKSIVFQLQTKKVLFWISILINYVALNYGIWNCWFLDDKGTCCLKKTTIWLQVINILFGKKPRCAVWFRNTESIAPKSSTQIFLSQVVLCQSSLGLFVHFPRHQKILWIDKRNLFWCFQETNDNNL